MREIGQNLKELVHRAAEARGRAVGPKSLPTVGAAIRDSGGGVWQAATVSSDDTIVGECAERTALFYAMTNGAKEIVALAVSYSADAPPLHPCGACLEAFRRFAPRVQVLIGRSGEIKGPYSIEQLLPGR